MTINIRTTAYVYIITIWWFSNTVYYYSYKTFTGVHGIDFIIGMQIAGYQRGVGDHRVGQIYGLPYHHLAYTLWSLTPIW